MHDFFSKDVERRLQEKSMHIIDSVIQGIGIEGLCLNRISIFLKPEP